MTYSDSLSRIKRNTNPAFWNAEDIEHYNNIVNALEKQIPKKLICIKTEKCCPICKDGICLIGDDGNYGNYCLNCG